MIDIPIDQMLATVQKRLRGKTPTSIIRYGDGESMILNGFKDINQLKYVLKRQFGEVPSIDHIEQIRNNLIEAYTGADIIGIPTTNRFMGDKKSFWYRASGILDEAIGIDILQTKLFTSIDFHSHWLDNNSFDKLLKGLDTICYISCRNLDEQLKARFGIKNVWFFQIAPEMKFTSGYEGEKHFPDQFNKIRRWHLKVPVEGNLCLVGAGVAGKIYNNWFRDRGGISVDVGSVFDAFAGKATRGKDRGMDAEDDQFKL